MEADIMDISERLARFLEKNTEAELFEIKSEGKYAITMKYHDFICLPKGTLIDHDDEDNSISLDFSKINYDSLDNENKDTLDFFVACWHQVPRKNTKEEKSDIDSFYWLSKAKNLSVNFNNIDKEVIKNFSSKYTTKKSLKA